MIRKDLDVILIVADSLRADHLEMLRLPQEYRPHLSKENPLNIGTIERLINKKKLEEKVVFKNRFVLNEELHTYILAAEMIVLPYVDGT